MSAPLIRPTLAMRHYACSHASRRFAANHFEATSGHSPLACCNLFRSEIRSKKTGCMPSREQQQNRPHRVGRRVRIFRTVRSCWPEQSLRSSGKVAHTHAPSACVHNEMYRTLTFVLYLTQTLLDKDDFADAVNVETAIDPEVWREQYEVCLQYKHSH